MQLPVRTLPVHLRVAAHRHRRILVGIEHNQIIEDALIRFGMGLGGFDQKPSVGMILTDFLPLHAPWTTSQIALWLTVLSSPICRGYPYTRLYSRKLSTP
jgi:hypothetical protein